MKITNHVPAMTLAEALDVLKQATVDAFQFHASDVDTHPADLAQMAAAHAVAITAVAGVVMQAGAAFNRDEEAMLAMDWLAAYALLGTDPAEGM